MKFEPDRLEGVNVISRHDAEGVWINGQPHDHSMIVPWRGEPSAWQVTDFGALVSSHFEQLLELKPEVVIFGSGERIRFAAPQLMRSLIDERIGVETMNTAAACRTYNVLASEGRCVVAALLVDASEPLPDAPLT